MHPIEQANPELPVRLGSHPHVNKNSCCPGQFHLPFSLELGLSASAMVRGTTQTLISVSTPIPKLSLIE